MRIDVDWPEFKRIALNGRHMDAQYVEARGVYHIVAGDGWFTIETSIPIKSGPDKSAAQVEFETSYKDDMNNLIRAKGPGQPGTHTPRFVGSLTDKVGSLIDSSNRLPTSDLLVLSLISAENTATTGRGIARVGTSNLAGRKVIEIINTSNVVIYVGSSMVTTTGSTRGRPIRPNASYSVSLSDAVDLYIIAPSSATYVVVEGA